MSIAKVRPSNLANIKRLANQLKKSEHIQHRQALDFAAQRAGFQNYEHARKAIGCKPCQILLTGYWEDRETFEIGRETLGVPLSRPLLELVSKADLKLVAGLCRNRKRPNPLAQLRINNREDRRIGSAERRLRAVMKSQADSPLPARSLPFCEAP